MGIYKGGRLNSSICLNYDGIKLAGIILMVISLPFSESLKTISILLILSILLVQLYKKELKIKISVIHYGFLFLIVSALISSIFANNPSKSLGGAKDILFYTIPFFAACSVNNKRHAIIILWSLYVSTTMAALLGIIHSIGIHRPLEIHSLGNQNYTAMYFMIVITSMISTIVYSENKIRYSKIIISIFACFLIIATVMTAERSSFIGLFVFLIILLLSRKNIILSSLFSIGLFGLTVVSIYIYNPMRVKIFSINSLFSRFSIWEHALNLFKENPVVGIGLNNFKYVSSTETVFDAHNVYLQIASQMGTLGLISISLIISGFLYQWLKYKPLSGFKNEIKYCALGGFLVTFVGGLLDTTLHHEHAIAFTLLTGLMLGASTKKGVQEQSFNEDSSEL